MSATRVSGFFNSIQTDMDKKDKQMGIGSGLPPKLTDKEKINLLNKTAPKMFYTPDEFPCDEQVTHLHFFNTEVQSLELDGSGIGMSSMSPYTITYIKLHFRNTKWDYLMVQQDQENTFRELFLGEEMVKSDRKYI